MLIFVYRSCIHIRGRKSFEDVIMSRLNMHLCFFCFREVKKVKETKKLFDRVSDDLDK